MQEPGQTKGTANMTGSPINLNVFKEHASNQLMGILDGVSKNNKTQTIVDFSIYLDFHITKQHNYFIYLKKIITISLQNIGTRI